MRHFLLATLIAAAAGPPAAADALLQKARSLSIEGPLYVFDVTVADGKTNFDMTVDQSKPKGQRVTHISPAPAALKGDAAKRAEMLKTRTAGDIWCSRFTANIPADAKRAAETGSTVTFAFTPVPGEEDGQMAGAYKFLNGRATLDKATGAVLAYEMTSPKPFKPMAVAKVDQFEMKVACAAAPDGRTHIDTLTMRLSGNAMMQPFSQTETRRVSNLKQVKASGYGTP